MTYPMPSGTPEDRDAIVNEIREKLSKIQAKVASMRDESSRLAGDMKKKAEENLMKLDSKYKELKGKFESFKNSTQEDWRTHKDTFDKRFQDLSKTFKGLFD